MAEIGWIDFSTKDRNRVGSILDMLRPEGQVDELGIGVIRDALADQMFPGLSTIQTRAAYFFIIPYILYDYLNLPPAKRRKISPADYLEQEEYEVMWELAEKYKEGDGVIGISKKRPEKIIRRPSEIYWNGLNTFNFFDSKGLSAKTFLNNANKRNLSLVDISYDNDNIKDDADAGFDNFFNIRVQYRKDWRENLSLQLNKEEAVFLKDAFLDKSESVLALLMSENEYWKIFHDSARFIDFAKQIIAENIDKTIKDIIVLAHDFAIIIEGAHIAYNQEIQRHFFGHDYFADTWNDWYQSFRTEMIAYEHFDPGHLFHYATTTKPLTVDFVKKWWQLLCEDNIIEEEKSKIIREQEYYAKRNKARIKYSNKYNVKENTRLGLGMLQYRFFNVKTIVNDVVQSL